MSKVSGKKWWLKFQVDEHANYKIHQFIGMENFAGVKFDKEHKK